MTQRADRPVIFSPFGLDAALRAVCASPCSLPAPPARMAIAAEPRLLADPHWLKAVSSIWSDPAQAWGARSSPSLSGSAWFGSTELIEALWSEALAQFPDGLLPELPLAAPSASRLADARPHWMALSFFNLPCGQCLFVAHHSPQHFAINGPRHPFALADARFACLGERFELARAGFGDAGFMGRARLDAHLALLAANELGQGAAGADWLHPERSRSFRALASFHRAFGYPGPLEAEGQFFAHRLQDARRAWSLAAALSERSALGELSAARLSNRLGGRL